MNIRMFVYNVRRFKRMFLTTQVLILEDVRDNTCTKDTWKILHAIRHTYNSLVWQKNSRYSSDDIINQYVSNIEMASPTGGVNNQPVAFSKGDRRCKFILTAHVRDKDCTNTNILHHVVKYKHIICCI